MYEFALAELDELGFSIQPNFFPELQAIDCRNELVAFIEDTSPKKNLLQSNESCHIHNFFLHGNALRRALFGPQIQQLHEAIFGREYCLRNAVASNIQLNASAASSELHKPIGAGWHRDTPMFHDRSGLSKVIGPGISYQIIIAIDESSVENSTKVIPGSHKNDWPGHRLPPSASADGVTEIGLQNVSLEPGDIAIIDDNLFHKAGCPTLNSRWMLFCSYSPWFVKPYFDFSNIKVSNLTDYEAHCLHMTSKPPECEDVLRNTFQPNAWGVGV
jgi:hypothetical protein